MNCPKCGNELREAKNREGYYVCDDCDSYFKMKNDAGTSTRSTAGGYSFVRNPSSSDNPPEHESRTTSYQRRPPQIKCPVCGNTNVDISFVQTGASTITRTPGAPTNLGRKAMKASTLGLWGLTGKRTGYSSTAIHNQKMALCKGCGHSWAFFSEHDKESAKTIVIVVMCFIAAFLIFVLFAIF
ncbi:MAG: hypothetical protein H2212_15195 [Ruminococcus sp.]|nr:hypothetical protein [Ruminococcus sp.]